MIILIPPSESKHSGGSKQPLKKISVVTKHLLKEIKDKETPTLYGLKDRAYKKAHLTNKAVLTSKTMPAIERYQGVVYDGLDYGTLSTSEKKRCNDHVRIVSALFGLISPQTLIPDYKLKIDKLRSAQQWLEENSKNLQGKFVVDLLPQAHKKAVSYTNGVQVEFCIYKKDKKMPAGHHGKLVKGKFVRWLIKHDIQKPGDIMNFKEDGFAFDKKEQDIFYFTKTTD